MSSANEDHLQITNQKCARNVKSTIKTSDMAQLLMEFIRHRHPQRAHQLPVSVDSRTTLSLMASIL